MRAVAARAGRVTLASVLAAALVVGEAGVPADFAAWLRANG